MTEPGDVEDDAGATLRRRFLREGSALMGGAVLAGGLAGREAVAATVNRNNLPPNVPEWMKAPGDPMGSQLYGTPSPFENSVVKNIPKNLPQYLSASGHISPRLDGRRCRISMASSRQTDCSTNAITPAFLRLIRRSIGSCFMASSTSR